MIKSLKIVVLLVVVPYSTAFTPVSRRLRSPVNVNNQLFGGRISSDTHDTEDHEFVPSFDPLDLALPSPLPALSSTYPSTGLITSASAATLLMALTPSDALAAGPDWGLFEGRIASMLHPIAMGGLLILSLSTGIKGLQYRRQRTIGDEISELKKNLPDLRGATSVREALQNAEKQDSADAVFVQTLKVALSTQEQIDSLIQERKDLSAQNVRDNHFSSGALLAFLGTAFAIEGPLNTYARAGKLFPGPHLYAGAGLVVLWAAAVACIPAMQKGSETARTLHIAANVAGTSLFAWQVVTGLPIMFKVIEKTSWP